MCRAMVPGSVKGKDMAIWNVIEIGRMTPEHKLRNFCRQLEQQYVEWHRSTTFQGYCISHRCCGVQFVTRRNRHIEVISGNGEGLGTVPISPGMACKLYVLAGRGTLTED